MGIKRNFLLCFTYTICVPLGPVVIMLFRIWKTWIYSLYLMYIIIYIQSYFPDSFFKTSLSFLGCKNLILQICCTACCYPGRNRVLLLLVSKLRNPPHSLMSGLKCWSLTSLCDYCIHWFGFKTG